MSDELHPVWQQVELLLDDGINLVPVRDRDETINGKVYAKKTPYTQWTQYQTTRIDRQELFHQMEAHNTTAVAMVCGAISGNLEGIDIDEKYLPGISARFFGDLKELYPDIYEKLRVHKTPSGGCHIPFRIEAGHDVPGSQKLALRAATDDELLQNPKLKTRCFIESRGTGGLMTCPPSMGYIVRKDCPIPVLTWIERCTLLEFCKSYNTYIKPDPPYRPNRTEINYYEENPFEHFNRTCEPRQLIEQFGWVYVTQRSGFLWFTKPGGKRGDVHASFDTDKRIYHIFSTNTDLEGDRAYNPSTILAHYQFNNDKQAAYQWLVQNGYGRIKPQVEQRIVRRAALTGNDLPANISDAARTDHQQITEQLLQQHPHGIFWESDEKDVLHISRERFYIVAAALGFRWAKQTNEIVQIVDIFIYTRDERFFYDTLKDYIKEQDGDLLEDICNTYEAFIEKHGRFSASRLPILQTEKILTDTRQTCYKCYQNGCVIITKDSIEHSSYDQLTDQLIWANKIQWRDFEFNYDGGVYVDFLNKAIELDKNREHVMRTLGYLAHEYKDETTAYFIVLSEQCPDPMQGGGSGKNLWCNLLKLTTTYTSVPGAQKKCDEKFLQTWRGQKIFAISDAPKDFNFGFLKELVSGDAILKKLFKDELVVTVNDLPKFIIQTNYASDIQDGGVKGRIIQIEFTGFFNRDRGVDTYYDKHFPNDWSTEDYAAYDTFICQCVQLWLQNNLKLKNIQLSATGWEKQFIVTYGQTVHDFINEYWSDWINRKFIPNTIFNQQLIDFMRENNIHERYRPTSQKINKALKEWCEKNNYGFEKDVVRRDGFATERGREILEFAPF